MEGGDRGRVRGRGSAVGAGWRKTRRRNLHRPRSTQYYQSTYILPCGLHTGDDRRYPHKNGPTKSQRRLRHRASHIDTRNYFHHGPTHSDTQRHPITNCSQNADSRPSLKLRLICWSTNKRNQHHLQIIFIYM
jgi:hypothetical protein